MADQKISELTALTGANVADDDAIAIVDTSATETKKIVFSELKNALDTATGFVRITGDTMTGALDVQSTITADGLTVDGDAVITKTGTNASPHIKLTESGDTREFNIFNDGSGNGRLVLADTDDTPDTEIVLADNGVLQLKTGDTERLNIASNGDISFYEDTGTTAKFFWDASTEILDLSTGLTVGSPANPTSSKAVVKVADSASAIQAFEVTNRVNADFVFKVQSNLVTGGSTIAKPIAFMTSNTERMRIDSSGNLLVGQSTYSVNNGGIRLRQDGEANFSRSGQPTIFLNRVSSDGEIARFTKDGTTVGSIGNAGSNVYFAQSSKGVGVSSGRIYPITSSGSVSDNTMDLGNSDARFKDLYLSGGIKITGSGDKSITMTSGTSSVSIINMGDADDIDIGQIAYDNATNSMQFKANASEAMRIDSSGNLLVGKTAISFSTVGARLSPAGEVQAITDGAIAGFFNRKTSDGDIVAFYKDGSTVGSIGVDSGDLEIDVGSSAGDNTLLLGAASSSSGNIARELLIRGRYSSGDRTLSLKAGGDRVNARIASTAGIEFYHSSSSEAMRIDSSGNVGIGVTSPNNRLHVYDSSSSIVRIQTGSASARTQIYGYDNSGNINYALGSNNNTDTEFWNYKNGYMRFATNSTERMRIDSSGNLLVGKTSDATSGSGLVLQDSIYHGGRIYFTRLNNTNTQTHVSFYTNAGVGVGGISTTSSSTAYNTSSDHRLKENVVELTGAIDRIKQLEPKRFNFIADADTTVDGFLAHEVQSVVPEAITGTHNEVDDDGNPVYQGIDQSKLVPLLVATIKELEARITALENT